jgi:uncharacterized membrane protein YhaH (DUF805 family)
MEYMFLPLKRYAEFSGRSRRMEYWMFFLFQFLVGIVVQTVMMTVGGVAAMSGRPGSLLAMGGAIGIVLILYLVFALAMLIPNIAVAVRRLHDTERTGWWLLAPIVPYVLMIVFFGMAAAGRSATAAMLSGLCVLVALGLGITLLVFMFLDGTKGPNKYGPDPKGRVDAAVFA